jgi:hypothetical protein
LSKSHDNEDSPIEIDSERDSQTRLKNGFYEIIEWQDLFAYAGFNMQTQDLICRPGI